MKNLIIIFIFMIAACSTGYHKKGFTGGYSDTQLTENVFQVSFNGNGYTGREKARDLSLLRGAEIAIEHGFSHFILVNSEQYTNQSTFTTPRSSTTTGSAYGFGNSLNYDSTTQYYGGQTLLISKPEATNTIMCFKEKPEFKGIIYEAHFVYKSITKKYGIDIKK